MLTYIHGPSGNQTHNPTVKARPPEKGHTLRLCGHWNQRAYLSKHPELPGVMLCFWESSSQWCEGKHRLHNIGNHCLTHPDESIMSFKVKGTTHPVTEHHISEDLKPQKHCCENPKSRTVTCYGLERCRTFQ